MLNHAKQRSDQSTNHRAHIQTSQQVVRKTEHGLRISKTEVVVPALQTDIVRVIQPAPDDGNSIWGGSSTYFKEIN